VEAGADAAASVEAAEEADLAEVAAADVAVAVAAEAETAAIVVETEAAAIVAGDSALQKQKRSSSIKTGSPQGSPVSSCVMKKPDVSSCFLRKFKETSFFSIIETGPEVAHPKF